MTNNYHILELKYLQPTNTKGSRLKVISYRFKQSITLERTYKHDNPKEQAIETLTQLGFNIIGKGEFSDSSDILITDTFQPFKIN